MSGKDDNPQELLEFPCEYQFKVIGAAGDDFRHAVVSTIDSHSPVGSAGVKCRPSAQGTYQSVSILVTLYNYQQLTRIYADLKQLADVKLLL